MMIGAAMARKDVIPWWRCVAFRPVSPARAEDGRGGEEVASLRLRRAMVTARRQIVEVVLCARNINMVNYYDTYRDLFMALIVDS